MATKKSGDEIARGADVPLALASAGPRDALLDPQPGDYVPDIDTKGLHVGEVRQPAEPVLHTDGSVTFETLGDKPSKFTGTYAEQVAANQAWEQEQGDLYAGREHVAIATDEAVVAKRVAELQKAPKAPKAPKTKGSTGSSDSAASELEADADTVADAQAAEDSK